MCGNVRYTFTNVKTKREKRRKERKRTRKSEQERERGAETDGRILRRVCEKNEKFSTTDHKESNLEAHVYIFAFFSTSRETKEYNKIKIHLYLRFSCHEESLVTMNRYAVKYSFLYIQTNLFDYTSVVF